MFGNRRMKRQVENIMSPPACQFGRCQLVLQL